MIGIEILFWLALWALLHTYIAYPLFLKVLAHTKRSVVFPQPFISRDNLPGISIIIPAHNEEDVIEEKIQSILSSDYPPDKIEILVGSDASTDRTDELVKKFSQAKLIRFETRMGKPAILNHLVPLAKYDIVVLTDANVLLKPHTLMYLVRHFQDPTIALVDSHIIHSGGNMSEKENTLSAETLYIHGESRIKHYEGILFGKMMGPFGGCFALRKNFYSPVPEHFLVDDFYINMKILAQGGKAIHEANATVQEEISHAWLPEFNRKIRIATGSFQNLFFFWPLLFRFDALSFIFFSHKVLRWLGPFFMLTLYGTSLLLQTAQPYSILPPLIEPSLLQNSYGYVYTIIFILGNLLLLIAVLDIFLYTIHIHWLPFRTISHFLSTNLALLIGFFRFLEGIKSGIWQPTPRSPTKKSR